MQVRGGHQGNTPSLEATMGTVKEGRTATLLSPETPEAIHG